MTPPGSASKARLCSGPLSWTTERNSTTAVFTPFKLTLKQQTPGSSKKSAFDLQAGLSHPLNYKPRKGKLKPRGNLKEIVLWRSVQAELAYLQPCPHQGRTWEAWARTPGEESKGSGSSQKPGSDQSPAILLIPWLPTCFLLWMCSSHSL